MILKWKDIVHEISSLLVFSTVGHGSRLCGDAEAEAPRCEQQRRRPLSSPRCSLVVLLTQASSRRSNEGFLCRYGVCDEALPLSAKPRALRWCQRWPEMAESPQAFPRSSDRPCGNEHAIQRGQSTCFLHASTLARKLLHLKMEWLNIFTWMFWGGKEKEPYPSPSPSSSCFCFLMYFLFLAKLI